MNIKKIFNMLVKDVCFLICGAAILVSFACSDVDLPSSPSDSVATVSSLSYTQDGRDVVLSWSLPSGQQIESIEIVNDDEIVAELESNATSYTIKRPKSNVEQAYTVRIVYANGVVSNGQTVYFTVESTAARIGYLISENDISEIQDDDEQAAANWFVNNYSNEGDILTPSDLVAGISPDDYSMIWIQIDRVGIGSGWQNLPSTLVSDEAIKALTDYMKEGGNLLLTKHATQLLVPIGRIDEAYTPNLFGDGEGDTGDDIWSFNANIGSGMDVNYDHRDHAIFQGLSVCWQYDWETYPLIGPGIREDHNCMWDCNAFGFDGDPNVVVNFEDATDCTVLGVWGQVADFCVAGIVEFKQTSDFIGTCIANGLSAYEWNQNSGTNIYQDNIELLTKNCIDYLK